jgi:soluble lytic murein transglycosylase-like protein
MALASYNAGASVVARYRTVPPFPETQAYVKKVTQLFNSAKARG